MGLFECEIVWYCFIKQKFSLSNTRRRRDVTRSFNAGGVVESWSKKNSGNLRSQWRSPINQRDSRDTPKARRHTFSQAVPLSFRVSILRLLQQKPGILIFDGATKIVFLSRAEKPFDWFDWFGLSILHSNSSEQCQEFTVPYHIHNVKFIYTFWHHVDS